MTAGGDLCEHVDRARGRLDRALNYWDAGSLPRCQECCELLCSAIEDLEGAWRAAEKGSPASAAVKKRLYQTRADVGVMIRLVDASTAFCRGLALRIGAGGDQVPADSPALPSAWSRSEA